MIYNRWGGRHEKGEKENKTKKALKEEDMVTVITEIEA